MTTHRTSTLAALVRLLGAVLLALIALAPAHAVEVRFERVAEGVYAFIGEMGARTAPNEGLNANLGLVVPPQGAVLIDSGATLQGAQQIHAAIRRVTDQPVPRPVATCARCASTCGGQWTTAST